MKGRGRVEPLPAAPDAVPLRSPPAPELLELDALYRRYARDVSRWIRRLSPGDETSDALHEVFLVVERRLAGFRGDASVRTWLHGVTVRVVASRRRRQRFRRLFFGGGSEALERNEPADPETPHSAAAARRAHDAVYRTLDRLGERDRALIVLFELEGLSAAEIGAVLGLKPNGVWVALHRARERFRRVFVDLFGEPELSDG